MDINYEMAVERMHTMRAEAEAGRLANLVARGRTRERRARAGYSPSPRPTRRS